MYFTSSWPGPAFSAACSYNEQHQLTGLLCYSSEGRSAQVIEVPTMEVNALYVRVNQGKRHTQVTLLSRKASPTRWFPDWKMTLAEVEPTQFTGSLAASKPGRTT
jgi:hypothetical protein